MEMSLHLIRSRLKEIEMKLDLLDIKVESIMIDYWPSHSPDFTIRFWMGEDFIRIGNDDNIYMSISEFARWYKYKQILFRKF